MRRTLFTVLAIGAAVLAVAGCGSSKKSSSSAASPPAAAATGAADGKGETIALKSTKLGNILVDEDGKALYLFEADKSTSSTCTSACAASWPPVTTGGAPVAEHGARASRLGTTMRSDGKTQVTYAGHPLYYYAGDTKPGQLNGEGLDDFGAEWYVLAASGKKVEKEGDDS